MVAQCQLWVTNGLFQNEYCVLASFCYAWSNTDVLLLDEYPSYLPAPTTSQEARLSQAVFYNMTGGASTMSQQNAIDAYYGALVCSQLASLAILLLIEKPSPRPARGHPGVDPLGRTCLWRPPTMAHILLRAR